MNVKPWVKVTVSIVLSFMILFSSVGYIISSIKKYSFSIEKIYYYAKYAFKGKYDNEKEEKRENAFFKTLILALFNLSCKDELLYSFNSNSYKSAISLFKTSSHNS